MVGVIIITHGNLGRELLVSVERILGKQEYVKIIPVNPGDGLDGIKEEIGRALEAEDFPGDKVLLVDIFGGTPANASLSFSERPEVVIISGVNLPMLISLFSGRTSKKMPELVSSALKSGGKGMIDIKQKMLERLGKKNEPCSSKNR